MNAAKLAQMNALHMDRKTYDEPSPQMGSLPPPPTTLAHQHFLKQMQRQYTETMGKPDIMRDNDEPLDLGKERQRDDSNSDVEIEKSHQDNIMDKGKDYYNKDYADDDRNRIISENDHDHSGQDDGEYSEDEHNKNLTSWNNQVGYNERVNLV